MYIDYKTSLIHLTSFPINMTSQCTYCSFKNNRSFFQISLLLIFITWLPNKRSINSYEHKMSDGIKSKPHQPQPQLMTSGTMQIEDNQSILVQLISHRLDQLGGIDEPSNVTVEYIYFVQGRCWFVIQDRWTQGSDKILTSQQHFPN